MGLIEESFDDHIEDYPNLGENTVLNFTKEMKVHIRFNSKAFAMLVYLYKKIFELPEGMRVAPEAWLDESYISGKFAEFSLGGKLLQQAMEFENQMFMDLELHLLEEFRSEYGLEFSDPTIVGRRIDSD